MLQTFICRLLCGHKFSPWKPVNVIVKPGVCGKGSFYNPIFKCQSYSGPVALIYYFIRVSHYFPPSVEAESLEKAGVGSFLLTQVRLGISKVFSFT